MKHVRRMPIPWDMIVFLSITTAGFAFSVQKLATENNPSSQPDKVVRTWVHGGAPLDLGCLESQKRMRELKAEAGQIRLRGRFCQLNRRSMAAFDGIEVFNQTNGTQGTVFFQGREPAFVTDVLTLSPGMNQIEIQWRERPTSPTRQLAAHVNLQIEEPSVLE